MTDLCVSEPGQHWINDVSPVRRQAIIYTNDDILLIGPSGTYFGEISFEISVLIQKMHFQMWSPKWRPLYICHIC